MPCSHADTTNIFLNMKLEIILISPSKIGKTVKWLRYHSRKYCIELYITGKENIICANISRNM